MGKVIRLLMLLGVTPTTSQDSPISTTTTRSRVPTDVLLTTCNRPDELPPLTPMRLAAQAVAAMSNSTATRPMKT